MHILHVTPYYAPAYAFGGVPRAVEGMATALAQRGHRVTILTTDALNQTERIQHHRTSMGGVQVIRVPNRLMWLRGRANLSTPLQMGAMAKPLMQNVDIVHCHEFRTAENALVTPITAAHQVPSVLSPHGTLPHGTGRSTLKSLWDGWVSPSIVRRFNAVIGLVGQETEDARTMWQRFDTQVDFHTVPNGIHLSEFATLPDATAFRQRYNLGDAQVVLFMGRLHPRKGVDVLARAFQQLDTANVRLVIAGPDEGLQPALAQLASSDDRIVLTGYLDNHQRLAALSAASVLVLPAVGEGLPMAVLEAMAAGLPVIVSPGCNLPEVAQVGAGVEVPVDEDSLLSAMEYILTDVALQYQMSQAAQRLVRERFTWEIVAEKLEAIYRLYVKS